MRTCRQSSFLSDASAVLAGGLETGLDTLDGDPSSAVAVFDTRRSICSGHDEEPRLEVTGDVVDTHRGPAGLCEHVM